jgi:hypothetical protein
MSIRFKERSRPATATRLDRKANAILEQAVTLRKLLRKLEPVADAFDDEQAVEA